MSLLEDGPKPEDNNSPESLANFAPYYTLFLGADRSVAATLLPTLLSDKAKPTDWQLAFKKATGRMESAVTADHQEYTGKPLDFFIGAYIAPHTSEFTLRRFTNFNSIDQISSILKVIFLLGYEFPTEEIGGMEESRIDSIIEVLTKCGDLTNSPLIRIRVEDVFNSGRKQWVNTHRVPDIYQVDYNFHPNLASSIPSVFEEFTGTLDPSGPKYTIDDDLTGEGTIESFLNGLDITRLDRD